MMVSGEMPEGGMIQINGRTHKMKKILVMLFTIVALSGYSQLISDGESGYTVRTNLNALYDTVHMVKGAEMFSYHEGAGTTIDEAGTDNMLFGWNTGTVGAGWTYTVGGTGAIASAADGGGGTVTMTSAANGLLDDAIISIRGTTNYNGVWEIDSLTVNTFKITTAWVSDQAGDWDEGDYLTCGVTGTYFLYCSFYGFSDASAKAYELNIYKETTKQTDIWLEKVWATLNVDDGGSMGGFIRVITGERITVTLVCQTDGTDFNIRSANLSLHKLD